MRGVFVTGTDTGVGKTAVACALARLLAARGASVKVRKPVESGCARRNGKLVPADAVALLAAAGGAEPVERVCPWPLEAAISPERAARLAGVAYTLDDLAAACVAHVAAEDVLLVEGAGGFRTPLAPGATVADLAARLALPLLLVVPDRLGCLNHALLTAEVIAARGLTLALVALNRLSPASPAGMDNAADLARWLARPVVELPFMASGPDDAWRARLADVVATHAIFPGPHQ
jgi:dethiobiotin synthetase